MSKKAVGLIFFDTLTFVEKLEKSGFKHDQAAGLAKAQVELLSSSLEATLATKTDLQEAKQELKNDSQNNKLELNQEIQKIGQETQEVKRELKQEIQEVRQELKKEIQEVKHDLKDYTEKQITELRKEMYNLFLDASTTTSRWMFRMYFATVGTLTIIMALFKFIH